MRRRESPRIVEKPAKAAATNDASASVRSGGVSTTRIARTSAADQTISAADTPKTAPGPLSARTMPPSAGPPRSPTLAIVLETTFAAVSSSGVRASDGRSAASAGWNAAAAAATRPQST